VGRGLGIAHAAGATFYFISFVALLLAAREWGWIRFPLPELKRQTEKFWAHEFGFVMASAMWGLHIGLGFATRITFGGFWILAAIALALGDPTYGAMLMLTYWLGRALPVWVGPALLMWTSDTSMLPEEICRHCSVYHRIAGLTLVWSGGVAVLLALQA